jgi:glycosyltransferase involved in cell wall biosynthesis
MNPLVSIVIPNYNKARDLERALNSVMAQSYSNWEALIVDNHSTDDTDDVVAGYHDSRLKLFKIHNHGVIAASRNLGIKHAQGEYVAFLDSDDWWLPEKLKESLRYLEAGSDIVYHDLFLVTKETQKFFWRKVRTRVLRSPVFEDLIIGGNPLPNSSVLVRKSILQKLGGLSEDVSLIAAEDFDAWLRIAKITEQFKMVPKTLGYYWSAGGNTSNPQRSLRILDAIEERYESDINGLRASAHLWWLDYSRARTHYELGCYQKAKRTLRRLRWRQVPLFVFIRMSWMLLVINCSRGAKTGSLQNDGS